MSWSTAVAPPERQHGPGWSTSPTPPGRQTGAGWFARTERVTAFVGDGTLTGVPSPRYRITASFTGAGALAAALAARHSRTATLTSVGDLVAALYEITFRTAAFTGTGQYDAGINDGLSAIIQAGIGAWFSGGGVLLIDTEGGAPPADGLTAQLVGRYLIPAYFDSEGQLIGNLGEIKQALADLGGDGILTADPAQIYALLGGLVGSGALSATAYRSTFDVLAPLLGSGVLSATGFAKYLTSVGFSGAGAFTALLLQIYNTISGAGGTGTVTALIMQKYSLTPAFAGDGTTTALVSQIYSLTPAFAGSGTLTALATAVGVVIAATSATGTLTALVSQNYSLIASFTGSGALTALAVAASAVTASFTGSGALAATALRLHPMAAALSGSGTLSATISQKYSLAASFTGGGTLTATGIRLQPMSAALSGGGTLSATVIPTASITGQTLYLVTIDHTKVAGDLTDFPVYINLADMPEGFWDTVGDGSGIRCYIGSTELAREVLVDVNELHTKVPALSSGTDTVITIVPDGGSYTLGTAAVWSNDYMSVYHLSTDPTVSVPDSVNGYDAVQSGTGASGGFGLMGGALYLDGATTMEASTAGIVGGAAARTMSAWVFPATPGNLTVWGQGTNDLGTLWEMVRYNENLILHAYGGGFDTISVSAPIPDEVLAFAVITYDGTTVKIYLDGNYMGQVDMDLDTGSTFNNLGGPGYFGQWSGAVDEARLSVVERSAEWIETEYHNQGDTAGFYSVAESSGGATGNGTLTATATEKYAVAAGFGDT